MLNSVVLIGRLTAMPELKTTPSGVSVCSFCIAVDRGYRRDEEKQTDFINIVAWRGTAEFIAKYFGKGDMIAVEGAIQTRRWQDSDGNNRTAVEVNASKVHFAGGKKNDTADSNAPVASSIDDLIEAGEEGDDLPF